MKKRVMCVFGTRPEAVKLAPVYHALRRSSKLEPIAVMTSQHREMLDQMLKWFDIKPDHDLNLMKHGQTLAELTSRVITSVDDILSKERPDFLLVQGDTVTVTASALASFYQKVPIGHVEAGLRTDDRYSPFPEEMSRRQTGRLATLHFAPTQKAVDNLRLEGITENVFLTGNTVVDALLDTVKRLPTVNVDKTLFGEADFDKYKVLLVTAHRRENWGDGMKDIALALHEIAEEFPEVQILYPIHKNPLVRQSIEPIFAAHPRLILVEPLDYVPFVYAMQHCHFILTDSGGVQEEAPSLGKPVLVLRDNTERPEAVSAGASKLVGTSRESIVNAARELMNNKAHFDSMARSVNPFGDGNAAANIVEHIEQYLETEQGH